MPIARALLRPLRSICRGGRDRWVAAQMTRDTIRALVAPPPRAFASWGEGSVIVPPARVEAPERIHVGKGVMIHEHAWLSLEHRPGMPAPTLRIGDDVKVNRFVRIECAGSVELGPGVLLADRVHISDTDHPARATDDGPVPDLDAAPRPIVIGPRAFVGAGAVIKSGVTIGEHAYVSANTVVVRDVPPRTLVAGSPARAVRRWDLDAGGGQA